MPLCTYTTFHYVDPLMNTGLLLCFSYCELRCCYKHRCANISLRPCFRLGGYRPRYGTADSYSSPNAGVLRHLRTVFHSSSTNSARGSSFPTSLPALVLSWFFYSSHSTECEVVNKYLFELVKQNEM